jgi:hypothetical protein
MNRISKTVFFEMFPDPSVFDAGKYNLLRVIQSALLARFSEKNGRKTNRSLFLAPFWFQKLYLKIRAIRKTPKVCPIDPNQKFLFICTTRLTKDPETGKEKNIYIGRIVEQLGNQICHIHYRNSLPDSVRVDYHSTLPIWLETRIPFNQFDQNCVKMIRAVFKQLSKKTKLTKEDCREIRIALDDFWRESRLYYYYLKNTQISTAFIYPAYQNESLVYALREAGIKVIELQHGVISKGANFYVYPQNVKKLDTDMLLPDDIWVWGPYWKETLLKGFEFKEGQVKVVGDFITRPDTSKFPDTKEKIALVTLSTGTQNFFIPYLKKISDYLVKHPGWVIWVKLHPGDPNNQVYYDEFEENELIVLIDKKTNISECLKSAALQISIFSNTLFEAVGTNTINFCLDVDDRFKGFVEEIISAGVACLLDPYEDPIERFEFILPIFKAPEKEIFFSAFSISQDSTSQ